MIRIMNFVDREGFFFRGARNSSFRGDSEEICPKSNILQQNLISGNMTVNLISKITGISFYKLRKCKARLLQGLDMPSMESLQPKRFAWTED